MNEQRTEITAFLDRASCLASIELQRAGFVPSREERQELASISSRLHDALRIFELHGDAPAALRQRAVTQVALNRSISSPVRRLPPELLLIVIYFIIEEVEHFSRATLIADTIASVCVGWRLIALGDPKLWRCISSVRPRAVDLALSSQATLANMLPLLIRYSWDSNPTALPGFFQALQSYATRWIYTDVSTTQCSILESLPTIELPVLTAAKIRLEGPAVFGKLRPLEFLSKASTLTLLSVHLLLDWPYDAFWSEVCFPPFPNLVTLDIHVDNDRYEPLLPTFLVAMKSSASSLVNFHLHVMCCDGDPDFEIPVVFPALRRITLASAAPGTVLRYIAAPALEELVLNDIRRCNYAPIIELFDFLSNPPLPGLTRLTLKNVVALDHGDVLGCMQYLANLEELHVHEDRGQTFFLLSEPVLHRLTCVADESPLLPKLATVTVVYDVVDTDAYRKVESIWREMIASRKEPRICADISVVALEKAEVTDVESDEEVDEFY
ncbi:hypothetical protein GGG16DRAFT_59161 [Schizophyllum commune]